MNLLLGKTQKEDSAEQEKTKNICPGRARSFPVGLGPAGFSIVAALEQYSQEGRLHAPEHADSPCLIRLDRSKHSVILLGFSFIQ
jgi:hypothetical protein